MTDDARDAARYRAIRRIAEVRRLEAAVALSLIDWVKEGTVDAEIDKMIAEFDPQSTTHETL